ncbi:MAG: hypothetical protein HYV97_15115 [Bdellovibrio sp.]|nr:hypothetical protein [Bdellovibrio sp.]
MLGSKTSDRHTFSIQIYRAKMAHDTTLNILNHASAVKKLRALKTEMLTHTNT